MHLETDNLDKEGAELLLKMFSKRDDREAQIIRLLCRNLISKEECIAYYRAAMRESPRDVFRNGGGK